MDRVVIFLYDDGLRRVRAVGSYGIDLELFRDAHVTLDDAPMAMRALAEDRVVEVAGDFRGELPERVPAPADRRAPGRAPRWPRPAAGPA